MNTLFKIMTILLVIAAIGLLVIVKDRSWQTGEICIIKCNEVRK